MDLDVKITHGHITVARDGADEATNGVSGAPIYAFFIRDATF